MYDAVLAEEFNKPTLVLANSDFLIDAKSAASGRGVPIRIISESVPPECTVAEQIKGGVTSAMDDIVASLTEPLTDEERSPKLKEIENKYIRDYVKIHHQVYFFKTPREILQFVGTEICRHISEAYHAEVLIRQILEEPNVNWIITDARFPNERAALKKLFGAMLVRIKRPGYTPPSCFDSEEEAKADGHASELSFGDDSEYDAVIINSGTIEDLQNEALKFI